MSVADITNAMRDYLYAAFSDTAECQTYIYRRDLTALSDGHAGVVYLVVRGRGDDVLWQRFAADGTEALKLVMS